MKEYVKYWSLCCALLFLFWFASGYEQQWFSNYQEWADWISFDCENKCSIVIWYEENKIDYLYLSWTLNWSGVIGYGFYSWDDFSFLSQHEFTKFSDVDKFVDLMVHNKQLRTKSTDLKLLMSGDIQWKLYLEIWNLSFWQKVSLVWKNFWKMEKFGQYGLNLRYGVSIRWINILIYWYIVFVIISLSILLVKKWKQKFKLVFYFWLWLFLFIWIRNTITDTVVLQQWLSWFKTDKTYFELWDYFSFVEKVRNKLNLDSKEYRRNDCKILLEYDTGFDYGPLDIYFKPCELVSTWDFVNYKIYYKKEIPTKDLDKNVLLDFSGSYLLEN